MGRSRNADRFNHDADADGYDLDVLNEEDPIRAGYAAVLDWVAEAVADAPEGPILDLGVGTGNLAARLPVERALVAVDVSARMLELARAKLAGRDVDFVESDILEVFGRGLPPLAAVVSTYALHHLEPDEKARFVSLAMAALLPGGVLAVGDLAFRSAADRIRTLEALSRRGHPEVREAAEDEYFWDLAETREFLDILGVPCRIRRFSALSWGFILRRP